MKYKFMNIVMGFLFTVICFTACNSSSSNPITSSNPTETIKPQNLSISSSLTGISSSQSGDWSVVVTFINNGNTDLKITGAWFKGYGSIGDLIHNIGIQTSSLSLNINIPAGTSFKYSVSGSSFYVIYTLGTTYSITSSDGNISKDFFLGITNLTIY